MKWNVEKMSPIIDAIIVVLAILTLLLIFGKDWFFSDESTMPLFIAVMTMTAYRIGIWSGRKLERMDREADHQVELGVVKRGGWTGPIPQSKKAPPKPQHNPNL